MVEASQRLAGIDLGGSKIGVSIGDPRGRVLVADRLATDPSGDPTAQLDAAWQRLETMAAEAGGPPPAALGLASPGPLSYAEGRLLEVPNMPAWQGFAIGEWLAARALPTRFMNDANASILAEVLWGAAQGANTALFLTMSTGMGAGLYLDGRVFEGPTALAGEIGHLRLSDEGPTGFGKPGSVEGWTSGPGITQVATAELRAATQLGEPTAFADGPLDPKHICELARQGDARALRVVDRCGHRLGQLCALLTDLLNPEVIVLGTIGSAFFDLWAPRARATLDAEAIPRSAAAVTIRPSGLEDRGNQTALAVAALELGLDRSPP